MTITLEEAKPFAFRFDPAQAALVIIDMQRDFIEHGGFGETLGNDVALLAAIVPACQAVLAAWRAAGSRRCPAFRRSRPARRNRAACR